MSDSAEESTCNDDCPVCGVNGDQSDVCPHFLLSIWEENFGDDTGAPLWMPLDLGYAFDVKSAVDTLFETMQRRAEKSAKVPVPGITGQTPLAVLCRKLRKASKSNWQNDYENLWDYYAGESEPAHAFNEYVCGIYRLVSDEKYRKNSLIADRPGLSWGTIYLWSTDPETTSRKMVEMIQRDIERLE